MKGRSPHNKGDTKVKTHFRDMPKKKKMMKKNDMMGLNMLFGS